MDIDSIVKAMKWPMIIGLTVLGTTVLLVAIFENLGLAGLLLISAAISAFVMFTFMSRPR